MQVNLADAMTLLNNGEVVAIPTETVYGLAADASNEAALLKIYATKQRPANNPLIVHIANIHQVSGYADEFSALAKKTRNSVLAWAIYVGTQSQTACV
jgi:L-threonylcarbamoyladenylate synthase